MRTRTRIRIRTGSDRNICPTECATSCDQPGAICQEFPIQIGAIVRLAASLLVGHCRIVGLLDCRIVGLPVCRIATGQLCPHTKPKASAISEHVQRTAAPFVRQLVVDSFCFAASTSETSAFASGMAKVMAHIPK